MEMAIRIQRNTQLVRRAGDGSEFAGDISQGGDLVQRIANAGRIVVGIGVGYPRAVGMQYPLYIGIGVIRESGAILQCIHFRTRRRRACLSSQRRRRIMA